MSLANKRRWNKKTPSAGSESGHWMAEPVKHLAERLAKYRSTSRKNSPVIPVSLAGIAMCLSARMKKVAALPGISGNDAARPDQSRSVPSDTSRTNGRPCILVDTDMMDELTEASDKSLHPAAWIDKYGDYLYRYALSRLRDGDAAEEVVQETFVAALRHVNQYEAKGSERAWLLGILKRKIIDLIRARNRTTSLATEDSNDPSEALFDRQGNWQDRTRSAVNQPLDSLEREDFWRILRGCLETLPPRQAGVFTLREMDDQTTEEICKLLEITASNLWVLLYRARLQLSNCMKSRWQQDLG